ncbi:MAG: cytochrome c maturation protein CcmE [Chloroflexi bacterium]|nr:cytochrome c maturation protein CcmE [Chloroflexota bacterium]MCC6895784.1 cytochrome c maturation protein CcmE [Anaerolineae bacterium]
MAQARWEKPHQQVAAPVTKVGNSRLKFLIGGILILAAVTFLIVSSTTNGARYYITVDELLNNTEYVGKTVRISGAVIGDSIQYDDKNLIIDFSIANIPPEYENLAQALYESVNNPDAVRVPIHITGQVKPDLLKHEAQAILTGTLDENGVFQATELLLKCPTRFQEANPGESIVHPSA